VASVNRTEKAHDNDEDGSSAWPELQAQPHEYGPAEVTLESRDSGGSPQRIPAMV
jgi:hypothetical protein